MGKNLLIKTPLEEGLCSSPSVDFAGASPWSIPGWVWGRSRAGVGQEGIKNCIFNLSHLGFEKGEVRSDRITGTEGALEEFECSQSHFAKPCCEQFMESLDLTPHPGQFTGSQDFLGTMECWFAISCENQTPGKWCGGLRSLTGSLNLHPGYSFLSGSSPSSSWAVDVQWEWNSCGNPECGRGENLGTSPGRNFVGGSAPKSGRAPNFHPGKPSKDGIVDWGSLGWQRAGASPKLLKSLDCFWMSPSKKTQPDKNLSFPAQGLLWLEAAGFVLPHTISPFHCFFFLIFLEPFWKYLAHFHFYLPWCLPFLCALPCWLQWSFSLPFVLTGSELSAQHSSPREMAWKTT